MPLMSNKNGDIFLSFDAVTEHEIDRFAPLTHALMVVSYGDDYLLAWNQYRKCWEIAGGKIDPGETPRQCAIRELSEETGQAAENVRFCGVMKFQLQPDQRIEYGALFAGDMREIRPFAANHEIAQIVLWDQNTDIGYINEIDAKCIELI
jgi:8-oxo-dGTP diphosphatase